MSQIKMKLSIWQNPKIYTNQDKYDPNDNGHNDNIYYWALTMYQALFQMLSNF